MITQKEREILENMAKFTATVPSEKFNMRYYFLKNDCGTVGCLLGSYVQHLHELEGRNPTKDTWVYTQWVRDNLPSCFNTVNFTNEIWDFLFNQDWVHVNNTPTGAVNRIEYFLKHGVPSDFDYYEISTYKPFYEI